MNIIIFGGSGGIGSTTTRHLKSNTNYHIVNFSKNTSNIFSDHNILACATDYKSVYNAISPGCTVIHLAGLRPSQYLSDPAMSTRIDAIITRNICKAALAKKAARLIFSSSGGSIYGITSNLPISENKYPRPIHPYGISKLLQENEINFFLEKSNTTYCILRLANAYGFENISDREDLFSKLISSPKHSKISILGDGLTKRDFIHSTDIAVAIEYAIKHNAEKIINIGTGIGTNIINVVNLVNKIHDMDFRACHVENCRFNIPYNVLNIDRAKKILTWEPSISLVDGIKSLKII